MPILSMNVVCLQICLISLGFLHTMHFKKKALKVDIIIDFSPCLYYRPLNNVRTVQGETLPKHSTNFFCNEFNFCHRLKENMSNDKNLKPSLNFFMKICNWVYHANIFSGDLKSVVSLIFFFSPK